MGIALESDYPESDAGAYTIPSSPPLVQVFFFGQLNHIPVSQLSLNVSFILWTFPWANIIKP
jgi:hypothetical protein